MKTPTQQVDLAVMLHTGIRGVLGSNSAGLSVILTEVCRGFPQSFQTNAETVREV
jgi:hypothetical protein